MSMATKPISATPSAVAIRRKKLDRKIDLTRDGGQIIDLPPGWEFTIDCRYHGKIHFDFTPYRRYGRDHLAGHMRDAIWSLRHEVVGKSLLSYENTAIRCFWRFLDQLHDDGEAITRLDQIDRPLLDRFLAWLELQIVAHGKNKGLPWSISAKKGVFSWLKTLLINRQKRVPAQTSPALAYPLNPFPNSNRLITKREPYSSAEQRRILDALNHDLRIIHEGGTVSLTEIQILAVHLIALGLATGRNLQSLVELRRDSLREHPLPDRELLVTGKRRGWSTHATSVRKSAPAPQDQEMVRAIPSSIGDHIRFLCTFTAPLIDEAAEVDRQYLFLSRAHHQLQKSGVIRLTAKSAVSAVDQFARRHQILDDRERPLKLNVARLRPTFANELYRRTRDLRSVQQALGHSTLDTTIRHYVDLPLEAERDHALVLDSMVSQMVRMKINGKEFLAADGKVPLENVGELLSGGYNTGLARCRNPFRDNGDVCKKFFACFKCPSMVVFEDDLWRLFSFYYRLLAERTKINPSHWLKTYGPILRRIDKDIASQFPADLVVAARLEAQRNPHPTWKGVWL